jgi:integrase
VIGRTVGGVFATTPAAVYAAYVPRPEFIKVEVWPAIRPLTVSACESARFTSVDAALGGVRATAQFLAWCVEESIRIELEIAFHPDHVERFLAARTGHLTDASRATRASAIRRVARTATKRAPWVAPPTPYARPNAISAPYTDDDQRALLAAVGAQRDELWERRLKAVLVLGLGAGLRPAEMLTVTPAEHVRRNVNDPRLWAITLSDRIVPIRRDYVPALRELMDAHPDEPIVGPNRTDVKNPTGILTAGVVLPGTAPRLQLSRLRITWMVWLLSNGIRVREFQALAGTVSAKTLETIAPHVPGRWADDEWLRIGAGL